MSKMVIEVPDQLVEVGKAMAEHLALLQRTVDRLSGGEGGGLCSGGSGDRGRGVQDGVGSPRRHLEESGYSCSSSGDGRGSSYAVQPGTSREAQATAQELERLPYSRASFERVTHLVGALAVADHQDIEDAWIDAVAVPQEASSVSVSLDQVSVPMEEPRPRTAGRPKKGAPKRPVERNSVWPIAAR